MRFPARASAAERGALAFGTVDCFLLWRLTNGAIHATDATNASRTLLYDIREGRMGRRHAAVVQRAARDPAGSSGYGGGLRRGCARMVRRGDSHPGAGRRSAERADRPGVRRAGDGQGDLRHRRLSPSQHRRSADAVAQPAADNNRLPVERQTRLRARGIDLLRRRDRSVAARRPRHHRERRRNRARSRPPPTRRRRSIAFRPSPVSARRTGVPRRAPSFAASRAAQRARKSPGRRWKASDIKRATSSRR